MPAPADKPAANIVAAYVEVSSEDPAMAPDANGEALPATCTTVSWG
jgi:hypothetical protein